MCQYKPWAKSRRQYYESKPWANTNYGSTKLWATYKAYAPTTITQTMDQQILRDDLQSICVQQQYTNKVKTWVPNIPPPLEKALSSKL